jgi:hypothetical protein
MRPLHCCSISAMAGSGPCRRALIARLFIQSSPRSGVRDGEGWAVRPSSPWSGVDVGGVDDFGIDTAPSGRYWRGGVGVGVSPSGRCWQSFSGLFTSVAAGEEGEGFGRWSTVAFRSRPVAAGDSRDFVATGETAWCAVCDIVA